jgi:type II secretory pathway pseudopilin PulG
MMRRLACLLRRQGGHTLPELISVMAMMGVLAAAFAAVFGSAITHSGEISKQSDVQTTVRGAFDPMVREIRQAYSGTTTSPIETVTPTGTPLITFTTPDKDCTGAGCAFHLRRVSYRLSGGNFQRAAYTSTDNDGPPWTWPSGSPPSTWVTLVSGITNTTPFTFLDETGTSTTTAANVRTVKVSIIVKTLTGGASRATTYEVTASLRTTAA